MERLTTPGPEGGYTVADLGEAVARLAQFENAYDHVVLRQAEVMRQMEALKAAGKQKSVQFRELLGEKLMNQNMLILWETYRNK